MAAQQAVASTLTAGVINGGDGRCVFALGRLPTIDAGPGYATALATPDAGGVFLAAKDVTHGIAGTAVDAAIAAPRFAPCPTQRVEPIAALLPWRLPSP